MRLSLVLTGLFLLTGCMGHLDYLTFSDPQAGDFSSALAAEYKAFSESELDQGRKESSEYFAAKGVKALNKEVVLPEEVDDKLPEKIRKRHLNARELLMLMLTDDMKSVAAQKLARAQLLFDCWQHQSVQPGSEIAPCYDEFNSAMDELQVVAGTFAREDESEQYLQFLQKSAMLGDESVQIIREIVSRISGKPRITIALEAFPAPGSESQRKLALKRLSAVHSTLVSMGIAEGRIEVKKPETDKTVHLSCDDTSQYRNSIKIETRGFGPPLTTGE